MTERTKVYYTFIGVYDDDTEDAKKSLAKIQIAVDKLYVCPESCIELILDARKAEKGEEFGILIRAEGENPSDVILALITVLDTMGKSEFDRYLSSRSILRPIQTALTGM